MPDCEVPGAGEPGGSGDKPPSPSAPDRRVSIVQMNYMWINPIHLLNEIKALFIDCQLLVIAVNANYKTFFLLKKVVQTRDDLFVGLKL